METIKLDKSNDELQYDFWHIPWNNLRIESVSIGDDLSHMLVYYKFRGELYYVGCDIPRVIRMMLKEAENQGKNKFKNELKKLIG